MKKYTVTMFFVLAAMLACVKPVAKPVATVPDTPQPTSTSCTVSAIFHGDIEFNRIERETIERATTVWRKATGGAACIKVIWDLDFDSAENLASHENDNALLRLGSDTRFVQHIDEEVEAKVLGLVHPPGGVHARKPVRMFLVHDRLEGRMEQVVIHEFGHVLGLQHTRDPWSVMFFASTTDTPQCLTRPDIAEFCRVNECAGHDMKACE